MQNNAVSSGCLSIERLPSLAGEPKPLILFILAAAQVDEARRFRLSNLFEMIVSRGEEPFHTIDTYLTNVISQVPLRFSKSRVIGLSGDFCGLPFVGVNSCEAWPMTVAFMPLVSTRRPVNFILIERALRK